MSRKSLIVINKCTLHFKQGSALCFHALGKSLQLCVASSGIPSRMTVTNQCKGRCAPQLYLGRLEWNYLLAVSIMDGWGALLCLISLSCTSPSTWWQELTTCENCFILSECVEKVVISSFSATYKCIVSVVCISEDEGKEAADSFWEAGLCSIDT